MSPRIELAEMDEAAKAFAMELRTLVDRIQPEQRHAIALLIDLMDKYHIDAGYKRMFRCMKAARVNLR